MNTRLSMKIFGHTATVKYDSATNQNWVTTGFLTRVSPLLAMPASFESSIMTPVTGSHAIVYACIWLAGRIKIGDRTVPFHDKFYFLDPSPQAVSLTPLLHGYYTSGSTPMFNGAENVIILGQNLFEVAQADNVIHWYGDSSEDSTTENSGDEGYGN